MNFYFPRCFSFFSTIPYLKCIKFTMVCILGFSSFGLTQVKSLPTVSQKSYLETDIFLKQHWTRPLNSQGKISESLSKMGISLDPNSCRTCHETQFNDWKLSLHSHSMGPGMIGQLKEMPANALGQHQACIRCHAPLNEQAQAISKSLALPKRPVPDQGLTCAGCHLRQYQWYGPPRTDGTVFNTELANTSPHGGWQTSTAFQSSKFCATCHQFNENQLKLNGKLLENTYNEWSETRFAREGIACQNCHMPDRRHLWKGIHDPEMVKSGVKIEVQEPTIEGKQVIAKLILQNIGVGHRFPTYVTPKVVMEVYQEDGNGKMLLGTQQNYTINREAEITLAEEISDTRLDVDEKAQLSYKMSLHNKAVRIVLRIEVYPDDFYARFYRSQLKNKIPSKGKTEIITALKNAEASNFNIFLKYYPLPQTK